jgi:hypothetical protein
LNIPPFGTFFVPVGTEGQPEFLGELFPNAIVTRVSLTLGTDALFSFDGVTATLAALFPWDLLSKEWFQKAARTA